MTNTKKHHPSETFDATVSLFTTPVFQISAFIFFVGAGLSLWATSEVHSLSLCTDISQGKSYWANCISNLWEFNTRSFLVAGSFFPIAALIASHLRSVQAAEQIKKQKEQSQFENHFKHSEEFIKSWSEQNLLGEVPKSFSLRELHGLIYPHSPKGSFGISDDYMENLSRTIDMVKGLMTLKKNKVDGKSQKELCEQIAKHLEENLRVVSGLHYKYDFFPYYARDVQGVLAEYEDLLNRIIAAISFFQEHSARSLNQELADLTPTRELANAANEDRELAEESSRIRRIIADIASGTSEQKKVKARELNEVWRWDDIPNSPPSHMLSSPVDYRIKATFPFDLAFSESAFKELPGKVTTWMEACSDEYQVERYETLEHEPWE